MKRIRENDGRLVGQRITAVRVNKFGRTTGGEIAMDPSIVLENGVRLEFRVQETESLSYGIQILVLEPK